MSNRAENVIGCDRLEKAVATSAEIFKDLRKKFPALKAFLVLAHKDETMGLTTNPADILTGCPKMVVDSSAKRESLRLLAEKKKRKLAGRNEDTDQRIINALAASLNNLQFIPEVQIELRFIDLKYNIVWALQADPVIDRKLTPQTKASIRIVFGNLETLSSRHQD